MNSKEPSQLTALIVADTEREKPSADPLDADPEAEAAVVHEEINNALEKSKTENPPAKEKNPAAVALGKLAE